MSFDRKEQNKNYYLKNRDKLRDRAKKYYEDNKYIMNEYHKNYILNNNDDIKKQGKEYRKNNLEIINYNNITTRCNEKFYTHYPAYKDCTINMNRQEFYEYFKENFIPGTNPSVDKDSCLINNKIYSIPTIVIIPRKLNTQLMSVDTCNVSNQSCLSGKKYTLQMSLNGKIIYFGQVDDIEEHHLQKSIINSYKSILLYDIEYGYQKITNHTYYKVVDNEVHNYWYNLAKDIDSKYKLKIEDVLFKI